MGAPRVYQLRCEYLDKPLGIDEPQPRLSWSIDPDSSPANFAQKWYEIELWSGHGKGRDVIWESGRVTSNRCNGIRYQGAQTLESMTRYSWRVKIGGCAVGEESEWSELSWFEMALLKPAEWNDAEWIMCGRTYSKNKNGHWPAIYFRKEVEINDELEHLAARVYLTSHGNYELYVNGHAVCGLECFAPGFTDYKKRLQYQVYDIIKYLQKGNNVIGVVVGDGWWRSCHTAQSIPNNYGTVLAILAKLVVFGSKELKNPLYVINSDESWQSTGQGPIRQCDLQMGSVFDGSMQQTGWDRANFSIDPAIWINAKPLSKEERNGAALVATMSAPVRKMEEFPAVRVFRTPNEELVVDFGQNIAGIIRICNVTAAPDQGGGFIEMQHGETLDQDGNFTMENLTLLDQRLSEQKSLWLFDQDTCDATYEPSFVVFGFRFARVKCAGLAHELNERNFSSIAIYSDLGEVGTFECSNPDVNQLFSNVQWSMKSNFLDIPTDCPTRERAGWTGDVQVFGETAALLMDTSAFLNKFLYDVESEQKANGMVTNNVPDAPIKIRWWNLQLQYTRLLEGGAGWGDVATFLPWTMYEMYGDLGFLSDHYGLMEKWMTYVRRRASMTHWTKKLNPFYYCSRQRRERERFLWDVSYHFGEWLEPSTSDFEMTVGVIYRTIFSAPMVATAYFYKSCVIMAQTALLLGKRDDAAEYEALSVQIKRAFQEEFVNSKTGKITPHKQASYVRALEFGLVPEGLEQQAVNHLLSLIEEKGGHIDTGFLSTVYLQKVLTEYGHAGAAYDLLLKDTIPSWLYSVKKGATTIWENWDGIKPDGSVQMSHNHYSPGANAHWLIDTLAGIQRAAPGYKKILFKPVLDAKSRFSHAKASFKSVYGVIRSEWTLEDRVFTLKVLVPPNASATAILPNGDFHKNLGSGSHQFSLTMD